MGMGSFRVSISTASIEKPISKSRFPSSNLSESSAARERTIGSKSLPNPNPNNYSILRCEHFGKNLVIEITYHDCTNYEGRKILVYRNTDIGLLTSQKSIDPHFCDNKRYISPFARFEPTEDGWNAAVKCAKDCS